MSNSIVSQIEDSRQAPSQHNTKSNIFLAWIVGLATIGLAVVSFVLSFNSLTALAQQHGVPIPPLFPVLLEIGMGVFSVAALYRSLNGQDTKWQWILIVGSSLLAGAFNVAHARPDVVSRAMFALPSAILLLSFESFLSLIKHNVKRRLRVATLQELLQAIASKRKEQEQSIADYEAKRQQLIAEHEQLIAKQKAEHEKFVATITKQKERLQAELEQLQSAVATAKTDKNADIASQLQQSRQAAIAERRQHVQLLCNEGLQAHDILAEIGEQYGIRDVRTIKTDIEQLQVNCNGNGNHNGNGVAK